MRDLLRKATWRTLLLATAALSLGVVVAAAAAQEPPPVETTPVETTPAPTAPPAGGGEILLHPPDGSAAIPISLADVEGSIDTVYTVRDRKGAEREVTVTPENGASVDDVLRAAGFDSGYAFLDVRRDDGSTMRLSRTRVRSGEGQQGLTPVIYRDDEGLHLLRPLSGPDDANAADLVTVIDGPLELRQTVSSDSRLKVTAKPRKVAAGETVELTAEVVDGAIGDRYEYTWNFGDGTKRGRGATVEHEFEEAGRFRVRAEASNLDDFVTGGITVRVGEPKDGGPDREGGGSNQDDDAPATGTYDGGGSSYDSGGGYDYGGSSYDSGGGSSYSTPDYSAPSPTPVPDYSPPATSTPPATSGEPTVAGNLLADATAPPSASTTDAASAARTGSPTDDDEPIGVPMAAWAAGGALGLLFVGAGLESGRWRRLSIPRLPRR